MACRDPHPQEKLTLGADPYDTPAKASLFHPALLQHSVLPILVVFTNDGDQTVDPQPSPLPTRHPRPRQSRSLLARRSAPRPHPHPRSPLAPRRPASHPLPGKNKAHGGLSPKEPTNSNTHPLPPAPSSPSSAAGLPFLRYRRPRPSHPRRAPLRHRSQRRPRPRTHVLRGTARRALKPQVPTGGPSSAPPS